MGAPTHLMAAVNVDGCKLLGDRRWAYGDRVSVRSNLVGEGAGDVRSS